jgi:hypothetical protein
MVEQLQLHVLTKKQLLIKEKFLKKHLKIDTIKVFFSILHQIHPVNLLIFFPGFFQQRRML